MALKICFGQTVHSHIDRGACISHAMEKRAIERMHCIDYFMSGFKITYIVHIIKAVTAFLFHFIQFVLFSAFFCAGFFLPFWFAHSRLFFCLFR